MFFYYKFEENMRKAIKLKKAAQMTASLGDRTLVETIVEIELAASCMPLVKSKVRAIMMTKIMKGRPGVTVESSARH
jgi:hypothetical protein